MKKTACLIWFCAFQMTVIAQSSEQNLMKYWKHRGQLNDFVLKGDGINATTVHGSYLPASNRRPVDPPGGFKLGEGRPHYQTYWPDLAWTMNNPTCGGLNFGPDCTMYLGWYIGVLATEYRLATNQGGWNTDHILYELWSALEAYERLDRMAETLTGHAPDFNGYFLRDDVIFDIAVRDDNGDGVPNFPGLGCGIGSFEHKIAKSNGAYAQFNDFSNNPYDVTILDAQAYDNTPSGDQVKGILLGTALVKACVDAGATVNGQSVRLKAQNIAHKIGKYAKDHNYIMKNANGDCQNDWTCNRSQLLIMSFPFCETFNWITDNNNQNLDLDQDGNAGDALENYHSIHIPTIPHVGFEPSTRGVYKSMWGEMITQWVIYHTDPIPDWPPGGNLCPMHLLGPVGSLIISAIVDALSEESQNVFYNSCYSIEDPAQLNAMYMMAALSNRWVREDFRQLADDLGMEIYPLLSDVLHNEDEIELDCKLKCKQMIDIAPCDAFYSCKPNSNCIEDGGESCGIFETVGVDGWQSENRYEHKNWVDGFANGNSQLNGLDFLLLYNLYHLKYPEELPDYYTDTYTGTLRHEGSYPEGVAFIDPFWYNCGACEEDPMRVWSNNIIRSKATISSFDGYTWNPPASGYASTFVGDVTYRAGQEIVFTNGFQVINGGKMHAYIDPFECQGGQLMRYGEDDLVEEQEMTSEHGFLRPAQAQLFNVYPNPNSGSFTITGTAMQQVQILEASGKLVRHPDSYRENGDTFSTVEVSGLGPGLYLVRVQMAGGSVENAKVVVN